MKNNVMSTQAKLLTRFLKDKGYATLTHTQGLEAIAHAMNFKSFNEAQASAQPQMLAAVNVAPMIDLAKAAREMIKAYGNCGSPRQQQAADVLAAAATAIETLNLAPKVSKTNDTNDLALAVLSDAIAKGLTVADALTVFAAQQGKAEQPYAAYAKEECYVEGELEFDDNPFVSLSDDAGAYVMGWYWIGLSDLPTPENLLDALELPYPCIRASIGELDFEVKREATEVNSAAIAELRTGKTIAPDTWLLRQTANAGARASLQIEVKHLKALTFNKKGECFEGKLDGDDLFVEFDT